jgi:hypothetical protein
MSVARIVCRVCKSAFAIDLTKMPKLAFCPECGLTYPVPSSSGGDSWYYAKGPQKFGPISFDQLRQMAAKGDLQPTDLLLQAGTVQWQAAFEVDGLSFVSPVATASATVTKERTIATVAPSPPTSTPTTGGQRSTLGWTRTTKVLFGMGGLCAFLAIGCLGGMCCLVATPSRSPSVRKPSTPDADIAKLQGVWETSYSNGEVIAFIIDGESVLPAERSEQQEIAKLTIFPHVHPKQFDLSLPDTAKFRHEGSTKGLFQWDGNRLKVAIGTPRPSAFTRENTWTLEWKGTSANLAPTNPNYLYGLATWNYWQRLSAIKQRGKPLFDENKNAKTTKQIQAGMRRAGESLRKMRSDTNRLPVLKVDLKATAHAAQYMELLGQEELLSEDGVNFAWEMEQSREYNQSLDAGLEALVRLMCGDPLGPLNDLRADVRLRADRGRKLADRYRALTEKDNKLIAEELQIRALLSQKYHREFLKLD